MCKSSAFFHFSTNENNGIKNEETCAKKTKRFDLIRFMLALFIPLIWLSTAFIVIGYFQCFKEFDMFEKRNAPLPFLISIYLFIFVLAIKCYQRIHLSVVYVIIWAIRKTDMHTCNTRTHRIGMEYINLSILYITTMYPQCVKRYDQSSLLLLLLLLFIAGGDDACVPYANFQRMDAYKNIECA